MIELALDVNGARRSVAIEPRTTLLETLREELFLTGTKEGCGVGECGNCMVLIDDAPTPSCLVLAVDAAGRRVETVEGLVSDGALSRVQRAFVEAGALQCGFCTPGMVMSVEAMVRAGAGGSPEEIKQALSGVLCRCGSYPRVLAAAEALLKRVVA